MMLASTKVFARACWPIATRFATLAGVENYRYPIRSPEILTCNITCKRSITSIHEEFTRNFRAFDPRRDLKNVSLLNSQRQGDFLKNLSRNFLFRHDKDIPKKRKKRIPKLILLQNPFTWVMIKIDFCVLRRVWDPEFQEKEFKFGTRQAISRVTQVISQGQYGDLNGLLTKAARSSLVRELDRNWSEKQRSLIALKRDDIQISSPRKVYFIKIGDKRFCDIDMAFLALKWAPINSIEALLFAEIFARFHREYTPHSIPEWTIAYFKVTRFEILRR
ncbi:m-AAA protease-interacting protein 1, mitochondrial-like [Vanessa atalanta]|uniref:m-AAA protease-interacting protein 1, mitochondrial-like n=1 Tax=Vanessa atalanta TaxID=42275 RepID=UPI001FCD1A07|nr:m-AAA protease-interacting protein 1, mitochondrial-like [Vanessa atalanta]